MCPFYYAAKISQLNGYGHFVFSRFFVVFQLCALAIRIELNVFHTYPPS